MLPTTAGAGRPPLGPGVATLGLIVLTILTMTSFAWPQARPEPHDLPVGVAGPARVTAPLEQRFKARGGAFEIERFSDLTSARSAIEDREVYGAIVARPDRPAVLTAPAASPAVAELIERAAIAGAPAGWEPVVIEVAKTPATDPRGGAFSASILPLIFVGIATRLIAALAVPRPGPALAFLSGASAAIGLTTIAITQGWLDVLFAFCALLSEGAVNDWAAIYLDNTFKAAPDWPRPGWPPSPPPWGWDVWQATS